MYRLINYLQIMKPFYSYWKSKGDPSNAIDQTEKKIYNSSEGFMAEPIISPKN